MFKRWMAALLMALAPLAASAEEMGIRIEPFTAEQIEEGSDEVKAEVFEQLGKSETWKNLVDLQDIRLDKYGILLKFERMGKPEETQNNFGYRGFFEPKLASASRNGDDMEVKITRHRHILFDDLAGVTCGRLKLYRGDKQRGKGIQVRQDSDAAEAVTVLKMKNGKAIYFESNAAQAKRFASNIKLLSRKPINDPKALGLGIQVDPESGRVVSSVKGTLFGKVPLYSRLVKVDGKKVSPQAASVAARNAKNGVILEFRTERIKEFNSTPGKMELRVRRGGKS